MFLYLVKVYSLFYVGYYSELCKFTVSLSWILESMLMFRPKNLVSKSKLGMIGHKPRYFIKVFPRIPFKITLMVFFE